MSNEEPMVVLRVFPNRVEAEMAEGALQAADIDAMVSADDAGGMEPGLWTARPVRLLVWQKDVERAQELLGTDGIPVP